MADKIPSWDMKVPPKAIIIRVCEDGVTLYLANMDHGNRPIPAKEAFQFLRMGVRSMLSVLSDNGIEDTTRLTTVSRDMNEMRRQIADWIFEHADFGEKMVGNCGGWNVHVFDHNLWVMPFIFQGDLTKYEFYVRFKHDSTEVVKTWHCNASVSFHLNFKPPQE